MRDDADHGQPRLILKCAFGWTSLGPCISHKTVCYRIYVDVVFPNTHTKPILSQISLMHSHINCNKSSSVLFKCIFCHTVNNDAGWVGSVFVYEYLLIIYDIGIQIPHKMCKTQYMAYIFEIMICLSSTWFVNHTSHHIWDGKEEGEMSVLWCIQMRTFNCGNCDVKLFDKHNYGFCLVRLLFKRFFLNMFLSDLCG